jgi:putative PIN family toxin of toxin-antitoxin system
VNRVTADSNIWVSALVFGGKPLTFIELALDGQIELAISDAILNETLRILGDKLRRTTDQLSEAEGYMRAITRLVTPTETLDAVKTDASDNHILEYAVAGGSDTVVSGDVDLPQMGSFRGIKIVRVADFLAEWQARGR